MPTNAVFGAGTSRKALKLVQDIGGKRILFVSTSSGVNRFGALHDSLGEACVGVFDGVQSHCPQPIVDQAVGMFHDCSG